MTTKTCRQCGRTLSTDQFHQAKGNRDGLAGACIPCKRASDANKTEARLPLPEVEPEIPPMRVEFVPCHPGMVITARQVKDSKDVKLPLQGWFLTDRGWEPAAFNPNSGVLVTVRSLPLVNVHVVRMP